MHTFFSKYPLEFAEMTAVKLIHKQVEKAQHMLKEDKKCKTYLVELHKAYEMLECFLKEKGYNPSNSKEEL